MMMNNNVREALADVARLCGTPVDDLPDNLVTACTKLDMVLETTEFRNTVLEVLHDLYMTTLIEGSTTPQIVHNGSVKGVLRHV